MSMKNIHVTEAEFAVLGVLWEMQPATIRQIADRLYPGGRASEYATVQKLIDRLEDKGAVERDRSLYVHRFTAQLSRDDLVEGNLRNVAEKLCDGSLTPVLMHLVQMVKLSEADREALRQLIDGQPEPKRSPETRGGNP